LVNILILRLCNYDKTPDHVESAGKFTLIHLLFSWISFFLSPYADLHRNILGTTSHIIIYTDVSEPVVS
jgi:hypothetical protein